MAHPREEVQAAVDEYLDVCAAIDRDERPWEALADMFVDDAVYIDPAWGRVEGVANIRRFMKESMAGLEDWDFPRSFNAIDGDYVVMKWTQQLPGVREDGTRYEQSGISTLVYAGGGKF